MLLLHGVGERGGDGGFAFAGSDRFGESGLEGRIRDLECPWGGESTREMSFLDAEVARDGA